MSAPVQKPRPAPVTTTAPTEVVGVAGLDGVDQLARHAERPGVEAIGAVQRQQHHLAPLLTKDLLVLTGPRPTTVLGTAPMEAEISRIQGTAAKIDTALASLAADRTFVVRADLAGADDLRALRTLAGSTGTRSPTCLGVAVVSADDDVRAGVLAMAGTGDPAHRPRRCRRLPPPARRAGGRRPVRRPPRRRRPNRRDERPGQRLRRRPPQPRSRPDRPPAPRRD